MTKISENTVRNAIVASLPSLWRFAMSLSGRTDIADDLTQTTCLRALERVDQVYDTNGTTRWLMTICRTVWYNERRAQAVRKTQSLDGSVGADIASDILPVETNIFLAEVLSEVMQLPEAQRSVVVLVLVEGYAYREAAEILDIPIGTIMSRLSSARKTLGNRFSDGSATSMQKVTQ